MDDNERASFVILHYKNDVMTTNCVESILSLDGCGMEVYTVIIDNGSDNGSAERLEDRFGSNERVHLLHAGANLGFSRANNQAYDYARDVLSSGWVLVFNNDTLLTQRDFLGRMRASYVGNGLPHVIAPDVYAPNLGVHQSPLSERPCTLEEAEQSLRRLHVSEGLERGGPKERLVRIAEGTALGWRVLAAHRDRAYHKAKARVRWSDVQHMCLPIGAALVFTPRFVVAGSLPFDPPTFLFEEEQILLHRCLRNGWDVVYDPSLRVTHLASSSMNAVEEDARKALSFRRRNEISALGVLIDYLREDVGEDVTRGV